ncbi:unnamed protein product [Mytilus coruscus]|uniref:Uncharacterized protein n=1 Tax=Mytilus coruscus TaxID=42192 RepID=A0A6J8D0E9_MYTCO|nr:unnamed protein product [Mytilus coruscus]
MYNPHTKPYWNADVKKAHTKERSMRRVWMQDGRPRGMQHESYFNYKRAKRDFRNIQKLANERYIEETYDDINNAAECDIRLFWKLIKRHKPKHSKVCQQIKHNNIVHTSPDSICNAFANYFEDLYTPADTSTFDDPTLNEINKAYREIERVCKADKDLYLPGGLISCDDRDTQNTICSYRGRKNLIQYTVGSCRERYTKHNMFMSWEEESYTIYSVLLSREIHKTQYLPVEGGRILYNIQCTLD